jgi:predicted nucleotide-binding protein (sugar kinase/HSP70/actin superfamily)
MVEVVTRAAREADRPVMTLVLDEHAGEAGYVTRIEAFADMLERRRRRAKGEGLPGH